MPGWDPIAQLHSGPNQEDLVIWGELGCPGAPRAVFPPQPSLSPGCHPQDTLDPIAHSLVQSRRIWGFSDVSLSDFSKQEGSPNPAMGIPSCSIPLDLGQTSGVLVPSCAQSSSHRPNPSSSQLAVPSRTHPRAKTSECLEKGSLSSSVSGESCRMISGAR